VVYFRGIFTRKYTLKAIGGQLLAVISYTDAKCVVAGHYDSEVHI